MAKKKIITDGECIYSMSQAVDDYLDSGKRHRHTLKLFYSKLDKNWIKDRGKVAAMLYCDGNGYEIAFRDGKTLRLDYSQARELQYLLDEESDFKWKTEGKLKK